MSDFGLQTYANDPTCIPAGYASEKLLRMPTMKERLELAVKQAEDRLTAAKRARELFDKNPDLEELLNILQRGNF